MKNQVLYYVERLPGDVAAALPSFASEIAGSAARLSERDLALGIADQGATYLGLVRRGQPATEVPRSTFSAMVKESTAIAAVLPEGVGLKEVRVVSGVAARAVVVAVEAHWKSLPGAAFGGVVWLPRSEHVLTVMLGAPRGPQDRNLVGGETSLGRDMNYDVDMTTFAIVKVTRAK